MIHTVELLTNASPDATKPLQIVGLTTVLTTSLILPDGGIWHLRKYSCLFDLTGNISKDQLTVLEDQNA